MHQALTLGNFSILGGLSAIHQFCHMGEHAMVGGCSAITKDIPAFIMVSGNPAAPHGLNSIGLKRRGFSAEAIKALGEGYRLVYRKGLTLEQAIAEIERRFALEETQRFVDSLKVSQRGIIR